MSTETHTLEYHTPECCAHRLPHQPGHLSEHATIEDAIASTPKAKNGYVDWGVPGSRVLVYPDGKVHREGVHF